MNLPRNWRWLGFLILLMLPSLVWVCLDRGVWAWDPAFYGEETVVLGRTLVHHPKLWITAMCNAVRFKPPGLVWLAQGFAPLGYLTGRMEACLLLSSVGCQLATLVFLYRTAKTLWPKSNWTPAAGAAMVAGAPLFVSLSHQFFVEPAQLLVIAWFYFIAARSSQWHPLQWTLHVFAAATCGMLVKVTTPAYCFVPGVIACGIMARRYWSGGNWPELSLRARRWLAAGWVFTSLIALLGTSWYVWNWEAVMHHARGAASGSASLLYGHKDAPLAKAVFWLAAMRDCFTIGPLALAAACGVIVVGIVARLRTMVVHRARPPFAAQSSGNGFPPARSGSWKIGDTLAVGALAQFLVVLSVLSLTVNEDLRFLYGCLPSIALMLMWGIAQAPGRWLGMGVLLLSLCQWTWCVGQSFGYPLPGAGGRSPIARLTTDDARYREMADLVEATSEKSLKDRYNIIGAEMPWLNANTANFFAAKRMWATRWRMPYTSLGYTESDAEAAWQRMVDFRVVHFISIESIQTPTETPDPFNLVALPVLNRIRQDADFVREPFPSRFGVLIYRCQSQR